MTPPTADRDGAAATTSRDGAITRDAVLATALAIIDRDGADAVHAPPRRRPRPRPGDPLPARPQQGRPARRRHQNSCLAQLHVNPADTDWAAQLAQSVARDYRRPRPRPPPTSCRCWSPGPWPPPLALRPPPPCAPSKHLACTRSGFTGPDALHTAPCSASCTAQPEQTPKHPQPPTVSDGLLLRLGLRRCPRKIPLLRSLARPRRLRPRRRDWNRGLDVLLTGLATALAPDTTVIHPATTTRAPPP